MKLEPCPKCGSAKRESGEIFPKGSLWDIRFKSQEAFGLSLKKKMVALACASCGYVELYLADHEDSEKV
jgi:predicted nucleic-acid-binding Zn-ribbon protein